MPRAVMAMAMVACTGSGDGKVETVPVSDTGPSTSTSTSVSVRDTGGGCRGARCGSSSTTTTTTTTTTPTTPTPTGSTGTAVDTACPSPLLDTAVVLQDREGLATVGATFVGEEVVRLARADGEALCTWVHDTLDWASYGETGAAPAAGVPCVDLDGNVCDFAFDVRRTGGRDAGDGDLCGCFFGADDVDLGSEGYGYIADYRFAGASYGPALMWFFQPSRFYTSLPTGDGDAWVALTGRVDFDGQTFEYLPVPAY